MSDIYRLTRRKFTSASASIALSMCAGNLVSSRADDGIDEKLIQEIRTNLLKLVNEERAVAKVKPVAVDDLATEVAMAHAREMAQYNYVSHWNRQGLKPYQRYSFAGSFHATQENVSSANNTWSTKAKELLQDTSYLHLRLYNETPPNDGHRKTILRPQQTHVGFGVAVNQLRLRVVELFVAKYVELKMPAQNARPGDSFSLTGRLLNPGHMLSIVEVFYEPLPKEPEITWLRDPRPYSLPAESVVLRPKLRPPLFYADRRPGVVELDETTGRFTAPINLYKNSPGIYTIVCWLKHQASARAFPATELCIRAD